MTSVQRNRTILTSRRLAQGLFAVSMAALAGCSADVTRFDFPAFNLSEGSGSTGSLPADPALRRYEGPLTPPRGAGLGDDKAYRPPAPYPTDRPPYAERAPIPRGPSAELAPGPERTAMRPPERGPASDPRPDPRRVAASGESIEVQPGDTLFGIARRYNVPVGALIEVNGLSSGATIKPGQRLTLPAGATPSRAVLEPVARAPIAPKPLPTPVSTPSDTAGWDGRYTLNAGDSLYAIARKYNVSLDELQRANGITDATKVRAGTVLRVPGAAEPVDRSVATGPATPTGGPRVIQLPGVQAKTPSAPADGPKVASRGDTATDATEAATARFRWPVAGRIITGFGKRSDGTHNDGINVAVPQGTEVRAAESGRIAYAGNELKGYGNLILIRHDNGFVTAYAHSDEILVKRDDVVKRGQVIARAGKTGSVDQPQLHFELRQGSKPIDPLPYLDRH